MHELKSEIIHSIYKCQGVDNDILVQVSDICDKFHSENIILKNKIADIATKFDNFGPGNCDGNRLKEYYKLVSELKQLSLSKEDL